MTNFTEWKQNSEQNGEEKNQKENKSYKYVMIHHKMILRGLL